MARLLETRTGATVFLAALTALLVLPAATNDIGDVDVWWIATAGRDLLASGNVPRANAYSFVDAAHPWVMHEWLYAVPYALGLRALGPDFFALVGVVFASLMAWLVIRATLGRARTLRAGLVAAALALAVFSSRAASARPVGSAEIIALGMTLLAFTPRLSTRRIVAIVLLQLVWTNAHGSFPLGVLILAAAAATTRARPHFVALALAAAVTFVNPYGWHLHALVLAYMRAKPATFALLSSRVLEYAPIWRRSYFDVVSPLQLGGLALLLTASVVALARPRGEPRARAVLALVLLLEGLLHARHVELGGLLACVLLVPWLDRWIPGPDNDVRHASIGVGVVLAAALLVFALQRRAPNDWIAPANGGAPFAKLAARIPDGARVYAPFRSAGLLLWLDADRGVRTLYDSRNDCYSLDVMEVGLDLKDGTLSAPQILAAFDRFDVREAIVPTATFVRATPAPDPRWAALGAVDAALSAAPAWAVRDHEDGYVLYERRP